MTRERQRLEARPLIRTQSTTRLQTKDCFEAFYPYWRRTAPWPGIAEPLADVLPFCRLTIRRDPTVTRPTTVIGLSNRETSCAAPTQGAWAEAVSSNSLKEGRTEHVVYCCAKVGFITDLTWDQVDLPRKQAWVHPDQSKAQRAISVPFNEAALEVVNRQ